MINQEHQNDRVFGCGFNTLHIEYFNRTHEYLPGMVTFGEGLFSVRSTPSPNFP
jgi:hypothetical protein